MPFTDLILKKTQREGLIYNLIDSFFFKIRTFIIFLKRGHIIRKSKIKEYLKFPFKLQIEYQQDFWYQYRTL